MDDASSHASARRLQRALTAANVGLFDWELRTNRVWVSPEWKRQLGYEDHDVPSTLAEWERRLHPDDLEPATAMVRAYLEAPWPDFTLEARVRHRDGDYRWILALAAMEHDEHGEPVRILGSNIDITERKAAELAVSRLLHFDQGILDSLSAHICVLDANGIILAVNRAWVAFSDANGGSIDRTGVGVNYLAACDVAGGDEAPLARQIKAGIQGVIEGQADEFAAEYPLHRQGATAWFELRASRFSGGGVARAVVSHLDITELKVAEAALRRSEARLASAQALAKVGSWHRSRDVHEESLSDWSAEMFRLLNLDPARGVITLPQFIELIHPDDRHLIGEQLEAAGAGHASTVEFRSDPACGLDRVFSGSVNPLKDDAGEVVALEGTLHDITERHRAAAAQAQLRDQLAEAQRLEAIGRLAGGIAHDFNNILAVIVGAAELGLATTSEGDQARASFTEILSAARRSADLTTQLLAFARRQAAQPRALDLNAVVSNLLGLLRRLLGEGIELVWVPGPGVWPVHVDPSQVDRVLANLSANARDAMDGAGLLTIATANVAVTHDEARFWTGVSAGDYVQLTVTDTGKGMLPDVQAHVFEPFFTTKPAGRSTGLGLATVFGIVAQNGGSVRVESSPGAGSTFRVILPRHDGAAAAPGVATTIATASTAARGEETILLVEDQEQILRLTTTVLQRAGYRVIAVSTPSEALERASRHDGDIDLVVTDVIMPGMHGRELVRRLTLQRPRLRSLFMSGYTADVIASGGVIDERVRFIQKPFRAADLCDMVRAALDAADA